MTLFRKANISVICPSEACGTLHSHICCDIRCFLSASTTGLQVSVEIESVPIRQVVVSRSSMCFVAKVPWKKKKIEGKLLRLEPADTRQEVRRDKEGRIETPNSFACLKSRSHE